MATTFSNINIALVEDKVIPALRLMLPLLNSFSMHIDVNEKVVDDVMRVPLATDPTVATKTPGTFLTAGGSLTGVDVTLNQFKGAAFDAIEGQFRPENFENYWADKVVGATYASVKSLVDYICALFTAANYGDTAADKIVVAPADFGQNDAAEAWALAQAKIRNQRMMFMMNTAYAAALFGSGQIALVYASAGDNFLKTGVLPQFLGLNQAHYADFPTNSQNLGGVILGTAAVACRVARPSMALQAGDGDIMDRRVFQDPDSGVSVMYTVKGSAGGSISGEVCLLYGASVGQNAVIRVKSAA